MIKFMTFSKIPFLLAFDSGCYRPFRLASNLGAENPPRHRPPSFNQYRWYLTGKRALYISTVILSLRFFIIALIPAVLLLVMEFFFRKLCMFFKMWALAHRRYLHCQVTLKTCSKLPRSSVLSVVCWWSGPYSCFRIGKMALHHDKPRLDRLGQCFFPYLGISN